MNIEKPGPVLSAVIKQIKGSSLILTPSDDETQKFGIAKTWTPGSLVTVAQMSSYHAPMHVHPHQHMGEPVFDAKGRIIGHVSEVIVDAGYLDISSQANSYGQYVRGIQRVRLTVEGYR